tara:strand:- start:13714 stop:14676 length:963 start_codon:yes stop_codon:yes gene_type:complete
MLEQFIVGAASDLDQGRLDLVSRQFEIGYTTTRPADIFEDPSIDAVVIATPISTHAELAAAALDAGKHVLLEKPMAHSVEQCDLLIEKAKAGGKILMVDHTFLYTGAVRKMHDLVCAGELGDIYYFDSVRVNLGLFQHDYNVVWDLAPHDLSIMLHLIDEAPVEVSAVGASPVSVGPKELESIAYITVRFASGIIAHIHVNWLAPVKVRSTLLGGSRQMIIYDDTEADTKIKVYDRGVDLEPVTEKEQIYNRLVQYRSGDMFAPKLERIEALRAECIHFAECIRTGTRPLTDGEAGREVVRVIAAADASLRAGGKPVRLD